MMNASSHALLYRGNVLYSFEAHKEVDPTTLTLERVSKPSVEAQGYFQI